MKIQSYDLHRLHLQLPRPIGDSQVRFTDHWMTLLELKTEEGAVGVGFELQQGTPTAGRDELCAQFEHATWPALHGAHAVGRTLHISRPRGGNVGAGVLSLATETALWDLTAKAHSLPLFRLLGGTEPRVRAYASTLDFHLSDEEFKVRLGEFKEMGFSSVKIKVGHPDVDWDLRRMQMAKKVMGDDGDLMVDANEAWSPKEALLRLHTYQNAGFEVFWVEDPITREDYDGYAMLTQELPFTRINTGEYLGFSGKRRLLECGGVDVLNLHGEINAARAVAHLAGDYGIPVSLGNTLLEIGVHLAASLPECLYLEFSDLLWNRLAREPVVFDAGYAIAPDRPGHGIEIDRAAVEEFSRP